MESTEKIRKLELRANDKSVSRQERSEAQEELQWVRFRNDKRPALSYRKFVISELLLNASTTFTFGYMFIGDIIGIQQKNLPLYGIMFIMLIVFAFAVLAYHAHIKAKFKIEPPDELSKLNMAKSANLASASLLIFLMLVIAIVFLICRVETIKLDGSNCLYLVVTLEFFHGMLTKLFYLAYDREDDTAEEDD